MSKQFATSVDYGVTLSKRICYGKETAPVPLPEMSRSSLDSYLPTAVMVYAVVPEPAAVDNPDVPSYQPYVHGRCDPPALIPLHMHGVAMEVDCWLDYAVITWSGTWRVHCIMTSRRCDCRIAIPMGEQGSLLGVEVDVAGRTYHSQLITEEDNKDKDKVSISGDGCYLKGQIYSFRIPQVEGATILSIRVTWSQKLLYQDGQFCLRVPFSFPACVNPIGKKVSKREKILLNLNSGVENDILYKSTSHSLKELRREVGKIGCLYEREVPTWSNDNFDFSYSVPSSDIFGSVLLQSPSVPDFDKRQMFCFYLFPANNLSSKVFRKEVVFIIDMSGSMREAPLENAKNALLSLLSKLDQQDSFNIIAFNGEAYQFSSSMELATQEAILRAAEWLTKNLIADGGTNILLPLKQAVKLLAETIDSIPLIFLVTDGTVEDEREICDFIKSSLTSGGSITPRISTFGIGLYCNHYFLQMLAQIGRGHYDWAYNADSVDFRMQRLFTTASLIILANVNIEGLKQLDSLELFPSHTPDLSQGSPLIVSGRCNGDFPDSIKVGGTLADMNNFTVELKARKAKDVPLDRVLAKRQIDMLTAHAWLSESKELEEKVVQRSIQSRVPSEYTGMILNQTGTGEKAVETVLLQEVLNKINPLIKVDSSTQKIIFVGNLGLGFGNLTATLGNIPPGTEESKSSEGAEMLVKAASNCCKRLVDRFCCLCCLHACSFMNDQCTIAFSQLCAALACFECLNCCYELCEWM